MTATALKLKIFRQDELTAEQKAGIENAIIQLNSGKGIPHEKIMNKYRKKYSNA